MKAAPMISALLLGSVIAPAYAQPSSSQFAGNWTFRAQLDNACAIVGQANLEPDVRKGHFACTLTTTQSCIGDVEPVVVRQSCDARISRNSLVISSHVDAHVSGPDTGNYTPDNFRLTLSEDDTMTGDLIDAYCVWPAVWQLLQNAIS